MLTKEIRLQIEELVRNKPCTIQEIALAIDKNWRTADRYVQEICEEFGTIATRTFREGSRGALKLAYWNSLVGVKGTTYQERLKTLVDSGRTKYDFSPLDIYQFADPAKRSALLSTASVADDFEKLISTTRHQLLVFSGNLSWLRDEKRFVAVLESLVKRGVKVKIITRVDITSEKLASQLLQLNVRYGDEFVAIRHCEQPLRCVVVDDTVTSIKEVYSPNRQPEIKERTFIYYRLTDAVWINWLQKVFWHLWEQSVEANTRIEAMKTIRKSH